MRLGVSAWGGGRRKSAEVWWRGVGVCKGVSRINSHLQGETPRLCMQTSVMLLVKGPESGPGAQSCSRRDVLLSLRPQLLPLSLG